MTEIIVALIALIGTLGGSLGGVFWYRQNDKLSAFTVGKQSCRA